MHVRLLACAPLIACVNGVVHGGGAPLAARGSAWSVPSEPPAADPVRESLLSELAEATRSSDWAGVEAISLELFSIASEASEGLRWLEGASNAMRVRITASSGRVTSVVPDAEIASARALREEAILLQADAGWSVSLLDSFVRLLSNTAIVAERIGDNAIALEWFEQAASETAQAPLEFQTSPEFSGPRPDDLYYDAARNALAIGDMDAVRRCLGAIDDLPVKRRGSGFHATSIVDLIARSDRLAAFRFAREWYERPTTEDRQPMTSRIASYAMELLNRGDVQEMREAAGYLAQIMVRDRALIEAQDAEGESLERERVGRARPLVNSERQMVSAQFMYSRVLLEGKAHSTIAPQLAREFIQRFPYHAGIDGVRDILNGN